jgi:hypothetical protein
MGLGRFVDTKLGGKLSNVVIQLRAIAVLLDFNQPNMWD